MFLPRPSRKTNYCVKYSFYRKGTLRWRISVNTIYGDIGFAGVPCYTFGFPNLHLIFFSFHSGYGRLIFIQISLKRTLWFTLPKLHMNFEAEKMFMFAVRIGTHSVSLQEWFLNYWAEKRMKLIFKGKSIYKRWYLFLMLIKQKWLSPIFKLTFSFILVYQCQKILLILALFILSLWLVEEIVSQIQAWYIWYK